MESAGFRISLLLALLVSACAEKAPLDPVPAGEPLTSVAAGGHTTCALTVSGRAFCWGRGTDGQLGNDGDVSHTRPVPVAGGLHFTSLSVGYYHTCGLAADGTAYCWGAGQERHGQLGSPSSAGGSTRPVRISTSIRFVQLAAGQVHTCGLTADGTAYCWGSNRWGQLGDGTTSPRTTPAPVAGGVRFATVASGALHTCGVTLDGQAMCWGDNFYGSVTGNAKAHTPDTCGNGGDARCTLSPHAVDTRHRFVRLAAGDAQTCAVGVDEVWWCWGGSPTDPALPHQVDAAPGVTALATGSSHTCAITRSAALLCQGGNNLGQLGAEAAPVEYSPAAVSVSARELFQSVAAGMFHTCAVTTEGIAYCWGGNRDGQLGNGSPHTCDGAYPCSRIPQIVRTR